MGIFNYNIFLDNFYRVDKYKFFNHLNKIYNDDPKKGKLSDHLLISIDGSNIAFKHSMSSVSKEADIEKKIILIKNNIEKNLENFELFLKQFNLTKKNVLFYFDGKPPKAKEKTICKRKKLSIINIVEEYKNVLIKYEFPIKILKNGESEFEMFFQRDKNKINIFLTEDSDMFLIGLNKTNNEKCYILKSNNIYQLSFGMQFSDLDKKIFKIIAILSGCDFLDEKLPQNFIIGMLNSLIKREMIPKKLCIDEDYKLKIRKIILNDNELSNKIISKKIDEKKIYNDTKKILDIMINSLIYYNGSLAYKKTQKRKNSIININIDQLNWILEYFEKGIAINTPYNIDNDNIYQIDLDKIKKLNDENKQIKSYKLDSK